MRAVAVPAPSHDMQRLWFATQRRPWSSLALVPVASNRSVRFVAEALASLGALQRRIPVEIISGEGATLDSCARLARDLEASVASGALVVLVLDPVVQNEAGISLAMAADAIVLGVELGAATGPALSRTLELLGRDRVLGTVAIRSSRPS